MLWMFLVTVYCLGFPSVSQADEAQRLYNQGLEQSQAKHYEEAVISLQSAIRLFPRFAEAHHLLGIVYFNGLDQADKAITHIKQAVALHPNFARAYLDLGRLYQNQGQLSQAESILRQALTIYPQYEEARLSLALVQDQIGNIP